MTKVYKIYELHYSELDNRSIAVLSFHSVAETLEEAEARIAMLLVSPSKQYTIFTVYAY
jgi:hypothetical protein